MLCQVRKEVRSCRACIHYQMHSLFHQLPTSYHYGYQAMLSDVDGSGRKVVNVYAPSLLFLLLPIGIQGGSPIIVTPVVHIMRVKEP